MNVTISPELTLRPGVAEFLKHHAAEADFETVCELARTCFPELRGIEVWLLEDPDEENHTWVALHVVMPASHPAEVLRTQKNRYYEEVTRRITRPYHPLSFSLHTDFTRE
jgi:hypothetical protein